jgi:hypothetical protein
VNVYFVNAGEVTTYERIAADLHVPETGCLVELVAAPTRSAATYAMWKEHERDLGDLRDQRWETKLIAKGVDRERGILPYNDPLWRSPKLCGADCEPDCVPEEAVV